MRAGRTKRASGVLTGKQFAALDGLVFGRDVLRAAFLAQSGPCRAFYDRRAAEMRAAATPQEIAQICAAIRRELPMFTGMGFGGNSDSVNARRVKAAEAREADLAAQSDARRAAGAPFLYDRRSGAWIDPSFWAPVPFVDGVTEQRFNTRIEDWPLASATAFAINNETRQSPAERP